MLVAPGLYNEAVVIDKADIILQSSGGFQTTRIDGGATNATVVIEAEDVTVSGFEIFNSGTRGRDRIARTACNDPVERVGQWLRQRFVGARRPLAS